MKWILLLTFSFASLASDNPAEPIDCGNETRWVLSLSDNYMGNEVPEDLLDNFDGKDFYRVKRPNFQENVQLEFCVDTTIQVELKRVIAFGKKLIIYTPQNADFKSSGFGALRRGETNVFLNLEIRNSHDKSRGFSLHSFVKDHLTYTLAYPVLYISGQPKPSTLGILAGFLLEGGV